MSLPVLSHALQRRWLIIVLLVIATCITFLLVKAARHSPSNASFQNVPPGVTPVQVVRTAQGYQLLRGGKPYFIKGGAGLQHYDQLRAAGANSVRLWSADYADERMDEAQRQGLTVMLGLWLVHESKKFDYYDTKAVERQKRSIRQQVLRYRHHPALLAWSIGNEVNFESANPQLYQAINDIAQMIHELDPYHPVTTTLTSTLDNFNRVLRLCPEVDFLSVNAFGNLFTLAERLEEAGWKGPYIVTEFGARGYWESPRRSWGAAVEQSSTEKAAFTKERYVEAVQGKSAKCLGSYVFFWGNKFEYTSTWFSLFAPAGEKTATVDVMQELWTQQPPHNLAPRISALRFADEYLSKGLHLTPGVDYRAHLVAQDPENDALRYVWEVLPDLDVMSKPIPDTSPEAVDNSIQPLSNGQVVVHVPTAPGAYRLFVSVFDGKGSVATANVPFYVGSYPRTNRVAIR